MDYASIWRSSFRPSLVVSRQEDRDIWQAMSCVAGVRLAVRSVICNSAAVVTMRGVSIYMAHFVLRPTDTNDFRLRCRNVDWF